MKFSPRTLLKLKNKIKDWNRYKKLKRESIRGIKGTIERPRLSVYRSNENIYAQIIDDTNSTTLISCSTLDRSIKFALSGRTWCFKINGRKN
jgi:large subunit ribosomal protein L18